MSNNGNGKPRKPNSITRPGPRIIAMFMDRVYAMPGGCWKWIGHINEDGYGRFRIRGINYDQYAHRLSFAIFNGKCPSDKTVDHTCHNRNCVNPDHLVLLSWSKNCTDANRRRGHNHRERDDASKSERENVANSQAATGDGECPF